MPASSRPPAGGRSSIFSKNTPPFVASKTRKSTVSSSITVRPRIQGLTLSRIRAQFRRITEYAPFQSTISRPLRFLGFFAPRLNDLLKSHPLKSLASGLSALALPVAAFHAEIGHWLV